MLSRATSLALLASLLVAPACDNVFGDDHSSAAPPTDPVADNASAKLVAGRRAFRSDTFGDESFWGGVLHLHEAVAGAANGGVGPGLSPVSALGLGLKVDVDALDAALRSAIQRGQVDLDDPATTLELLRRESVVGVTGFF